jgi:hypothetical protein
MQYNIGQHRSGHSLVALLRRGYRCCPAAIGQQYFNGAIIKAVQHNENNKKVDALTNNNEKISFNNMHQYCCLLPCTAAFAITPGR